MKIPRFIALAVVAVLTVVTMGFLGITVYAQARTAPGNQTQTTPNQTNPGQTQAKGFLQATEQAEPAEAGDTDQVQEQVGDQNGTDTTDQAGIDTQEQTQGPDQGTEVNGAAESDSQDAAPAGTPAIQAGTALQAAQKYLKTTQTGKVKLDDENGKLVYSVDFGSQEVKVDAMSGAVLGVDAGND